MGESGIPKEVTYASYIILLDIFTGIIVSAIMYYLYEDWTAGVGLIIAIVGVWVFLEIKKMNPTAWQLGIILNLAGLALYLLGNIMVGLSGALLCLISVIYLYSPAVRQHFQ
ncbi:MAG: hypothetical protein ACFFEF_03695 [Candidatus Thorarchaeota archaeon]